MEEVERLTAEVVAWIDRELGRDYAWPGNFRELGQCVRNVMIRGSYRPPWPSETAVGSRTRRRVAPPDPGVEVTADELLGRYYALASIDRTEATRQPAGGWASTGESSRAGLTSLPREAQELEDPFSAMLVRPAHKSFTVPFTRIMQGSNRHRYYFGSVKVSGLTLSSTLNSVSSMLRNFSPSRLAFDFRGFLKATEILVVGERSLVSVLVALEADDPGNQLHGEPAFLVEVEGEVLAIGAGDLEARAGLSPTFSSHGRVDLETLST